MTSIIVFVGRCHPCTPPSPMPTDPSSACIFISSHRLHRKVSTFSIIVFFITECHPFGDMTCWCACIVIEVYKMYASGGAM